MATTEGQFSYSLVLLSNDTTSLLLSFSYMPNRTPAQIPSYFLQWHSQVNRPVVYGSRDSWYLLSPAIWYVEKIILLSLWESAVPVNAAGKRSLKLASLTNTRMLLSLPVYLKIHTLNMKFIFAFLWTMSKGEHNADKYTHTKPHSECDDVMKNVMKFYMNNLVSSFCIVTFCKMLKDQYIIIKVEHVYSIPKFMLFCFNKPQGFQQLVISAMVGGHTGAC